MGLLSLSIWVPIAFGALLLLFGREGQANLVRWLALIGSLVGIPLGIWLHGFVMGQLSFDMVSFHVVIKPLSYVFSVAMTFLFAFGVDLVMRPRLAKINMVESLKAIE